MKIIWKRSVLFLKKYLKNKVNPTLPTGLSYVIKITHFFKLQTYLNIKSNPVRANCHHLLIKHINTQAAQNLSDCRQKLNMLKLRRRKKIDWAVKRNLGICKKAVKE